MRSRGTVTPHGDRFRARITVRGRQIHAGIFDDEAEAWAQIDAIVAEAERIGSSKMPTLSEHGEAWLDRRELAGNVVAVGRERSAWRAHVEGSEVASLPLDCIRARDVREFVRATAAKNAVRVVRKGRDGHERIDTGRKVSRQVVKTALRLLRGALTDAVREELIAENVALADISDLMPRQGSKKAWTFLDEGEIRALLSCDAIPHEARCLYAVAIYTGLRRGELWALRRCDVELDKTRAHVVVTRSNDGDTKSGNARHVPLLEPARLAILALDKKHPDDLLFPARDGSQRGEDDDGGWFDIASTKRATRPGHRTLAGITRPVRFHDLRHTCASHLLMGTWAPSLIARPLRLEEVRDWLGHSSIEMTERYAHLADDSLQRLARRHGRDTGAAAKAKAKRGSAVKKGISEQRAMQDSNLRPSAPEADGEANDLGWLRENVAEMSRRAARYLRAVEARDPYAIDIGLELADAALELATSIGGGGLALGAGDADRSVVASPLRRDDAAAHEVRLAGDPSRKPALRRLRRVVR